ncbi:AmmeMemoRadiSam system protein B [Alkalilimnicola ehrlichii MLHE-1]|uniref:Dioxygenase-like protein n=1 Tax=Alkalilimnicola ehrlichii (strain ATCC BAA-1101 / DSM 17681 / MLHE-1) TaxID=187272 RepID=Q0ABA7_ALKEH|nr:AmmeMemoRadiSam system protein B [Alkalilimnicola ehrlichii]ABI55880.1 dioxygenase-like protein [Alkalilimnicola ehrlichii MLHE-1]
MSEVRRPVAAGLFYPGHPELLRQSLDTLLRAHPTLGTRPRALVLPPGGQARAGAAIAAACSLLQAAAAPPNRVYLLATTPHRTAEGPAFSGKRQFATPLGRLTLDAAGIERLQDDAGGALDDRAHALEHRLEAPLPYLQRVLPPFQLVPVLLPEAGTTSAACGRILQLALEDRAGLLVVVDAPDGPLDRQLQVQARALGLDRQPAPSAPDHRREGPDAPLAHSFH